MKRKIDLFMKMYAAEGDLYLTNSSFSLGKEYKKIPYFAIHDTAKKKTNTAHVIGVKNSKTISVPKQRNY